MDQRVSALRGEARQTEIRLNGANEFEAVTVVQCDFLYPLGIGEIIGILQTTA
jgi:hypothetical protein